MNSETDFSAQKIQTGRELDLSGLKLVYGGLILQLISLLFTGRLASALMNGTAGSGVVSFVINAVALCLILAGLTILWFFACAGITKGVMKLTGAILTGIKTSFVGKEN